MRMRGISNGSLNLAMTTFNINALPRGERDLYFARFVVRASCFVTNDDSSATKSPIVSIPISGWMGVGIIRLTFAKWLAKFIHQRVHG